MSNSRHLDLGEELATGTANYTGYHRDVDPSKGIDIIPLGNKGRDAHEYGVDYIEERQSLDKYSKYTR